ncbi:helix-hairpin-helix domain-containing protein [Dactylosporangium roseum]|uniref:Helix-hairpin-helix domain-containing protein n=1 Tax=Dactylosporangium roseum TaxID=47989 RepID=A0ABY5Z245_9ACTN|nr:helix-hairpin-helix domain-containing protein [Dactylosporangium roseum]UWZ35130.1 helix-hairpin-helix domain-containing protein [Dactylosporangium roseum]
MSFSRKLLSSGWVLLSLLGLGCLSGLGLLVVGLRARRPAWWVSGLGYLLATWAVFIAFERVDRDSPASGNLALTFFGLWLASVIHSLIVNPGWLRWQEERLAAARRLAPPPSFPPAPAGFGPAPFGPVQAAPPPSASPAVPVSPQAAFPATPGPVQAAPSSRFPGSPSPSLSPSPGTPVGFGFPDPTSGLPGEGAAPVFGPVDVNTATAAELAGFGEFDLAGAERIVAERTARGGFGSIEEFAIVAQLAPHQFARLRHQVRCGSRPDIPSAGRVLDF